MIIQANNLARAAANPRSRDAQVLQYYKFNTCNRVDYVSHGACLRYGSGFFLISTKSCTAFTAFCADHEIFR